MKLSSMTPIAAALAMSMSSAVLAESAATPSTPASGAAKTADEGKCGAEKMKAAGNEGSCGANMKGMAEAKPGDAALKGEVMAPVGKVKAAKEGKCGEGKCGAKKMKAVKDAPANPAAVPAK